VLKYAPNCTRISIVFYPWSGPDST
jgi:hypothetical protein